MGWLLASTILIPLAGGIAISFTPPSAPKTARNVAIAFSAVVTAIAGALWFSFDRSTAALQFELDLAWVPSLGTDFHLGVDGFAMPMVLLTAVLTLLAVIASSKITHLPRRYFSLLMLLEAGLMGVFISLDLILFYVFWEVVLIPMFFLINVWGGPNRAYASVKFFVYTMAGSLAMLAGFIAIYLNCGATTFDMTTLAPMAAALDPGVQTAIFAAIAFALAIKVPMFPFHTWLPDAHVEAPTAVSVLLAGVLLKMGSYGFIRFGPQLLPAGFAALAPIIAVLAIISIVYGGAVALMQSDLKRLVAYSSVSHMGYVMLGIAAGTSTGLTGANVQMFSHGLIAGLAFLLVGCFYERAHTREISAFGGTVKVAPVLSGALVFMAFASLGLPAGSGFIGEFMVLAGSFDVFPVYTSLAAAAVVLTAAYLLWMLRRVVFGPLNPERAEMPDITPTESATVFPLAALILIVGVFPTTLVGAIQASAAELARVLGG